MIIVERTNGVARAPLSLQQVTFAASLALNVSSKG